MKLNAASVRFEHLNKDVIYNINDVDAKPGDTVVVETDFGLDMGLLIENAREIEPNPEEPPIKKILRVASPEDYELLKSMAEKQDNAMVVCAEEVDKAKLGMKLVSARYSFDGSKVTFCYTADARVDFRELVKTLASRLQTRIELRQVGVRDEARLFGGYGPCGRRLCCSSFLRDFTSVSIKMAKEQGLPLNPMKISGICGRLFCCLKYEYDEYLRLRKLLPDVGDIVTQDEVKGRVTQVNVIKRSVNIATEGGGWTELKIKLTEDGDAAESFSLKIEKRGRSNDDIPDDEELRALEDNPEPRGRSGGRGGSRPQRGDGKTRSGDRRNDRQGGDRNRGGDRPSDKPKNDGDKPEAGGDDNRRQNDRSRNDRQGGDRNRGGDRRNDRQGGDRNRGDRNRNDNNRTENNRGENNRNDSNRRPENKPQGDAPPKETPPTSGGGEAPAE